jgi:hypothetical protein
MELFAVTVMKNKVSKKITADGKEKLEVSTYQDIWQYNRAINSIVA